MTPRRIQRQRTKGWRMPAGAIYVGRPTRWGNPFPWSGDWIVWAAVARGFRADRPGRIAAAVAFYREWLTATPARGPLADNEEGGVIVYESGVSMTVGQAAQRLAASVVQIHSHEVKVPVPPLIENIVAELRGHDLACWCPPGAPCHADVLLEIANQGDQ